MQTHKFRLYPSRKTEQKLLETLEICRQGHNTFLGELNNQKEIDKSQIQGTIPDMKICECGCGKEIKIKPYHKYYGVPIYISGHNPTKHSEEFKIKLSKRQSGENNISKREDIKEKMRIAKLKNPQKYWLGKKRNINARYMQSQRKIIGMQGKNHSKETKEKMSILKSKQTSELIISGKLFNGNSKFRGWFWSYKNNRNIYYQSFYEEICLYRLEMDEDVISFDRCKFFVEYLIDGKVKRYIPDFIISYKNSLKKILEIKPKALIKFNNLKIEAIKKYCFGKNIEFIILTEKELEINPRDYNSALEIKRLCLQKIRQELPEYKHLETEALPIGQLLSMKNEAPCES